MADTVLPEILPNTRDGDGNNSQPHVKEYYQKLGAWCDAAAEEGVALQQDIPEIKQIQEALDYLMGMQWGKAAIPSYRAKPVSNELLEMFWEAIGLLTDIKPMFKISDIGGDGKYSHVVSILNKLARGWASTTLFERRVAFCTMFGMLTTAPAKLYWNPFARGYSCDPSDGDLTLEVLPATGLLRVGAADDIQDDECVIYRKVRTLDWIKRAYPTTGKFVKPEEAQSKYTIESPAPITVMPTLYQSLSPAGKRLVGQGDRQSTESVYPRAEVYEFWMKDPTRNESSETKMMGPKDAAWKYMVKPGEMLYPRGRVIIRANHRTLYDEPNPYFHRKFPFALLGLFAVPWQQYAMSVIQPWMKQQDILNQIMAGLLQCIKKAVNPPLIAARSAISPEAMRAIDSSKPNLKITYSQNAPAAPAFGQPPNIPTYVLQAYGIVQKSMQQMSGASAVGDALGKKQVPGGDTLDKITFSKNTPIRYMGRSIESFLDEIGTMWTADALQFYDAGRRMELLGEEGLSKEDVDDKPGSLIPDGTKSEDFVRRYKFKTDKATLLNVQRQDRIQIAFALRKNHDLSRKKLFEELGWNINQQENDAELAEEAKAIAMAQAAAGIKPGHKK